MERWRSEARAHEKEMFGMFVRVMGECNNALTNMLRVSSGGGKVEVKDKGGSVNNHFEEEDDHDVVGSDVGAIEEDGEGISDEHGGEVSE